MKIIRRTERIAQTSSEQQEKQRGPKGVTIGLGVAAVALAGISAASFLPKSGGAEQATADPSSKPSVSAPKVPITHKPSPKATTKPVPKKPSISPSIEDIKNLEKRYPSAQTIVSAGSTCLVGFPGHIKHPSSQLTNEQRLQISFVNLKAAKLSAKGYQTFKKLQMVDQVLQTRRAHSSNFDGTINGAGLPSQLPGGARNFVFEHTSIAEGIESNWTGAQFADYVASPGITPKSTPFAQRKGYQYYTNRQAVGGTHTYHLTNTYTNSLAAGNNTIEAVQTAACEQASVLPAQYENDIYTATEFLIDGHYVSKGKPVTPVVNAVLKGRGEIEPALHRDFQSPIMDEVRKDETAELHSLGYTG